MELSMVILDLIIKWEIWIDTTVNLQSKKRKIWVI